MISAEGRHILYTSFYMKLKREILKLGGETVKNVLLQFSVVYVDVED